MRYLCYEMKQEKVSYKKFVFSLSLCIKGNIIIIRIKYKFVHVNCTPRPGLYSNVRALTLLLLHYTRFGDGFVENHNLLKKIEKCRNQMITLSYSHGYTSEAVIKSSKRLDSLLNTYKKR